MVFISPFSSTRTTVASFAIAAGAAVVTCAMYWAFVSSAFAVILCSCATLTAANMTASTATFRRIWASWIFSKDMKNRAAAFYSEARCGQVADCHGPFCLSRDLSTYAQQSSEWLATKQIGKEHA